MYTVGPGIWQETLKNMEMRNGRSRTWIMVRKMKNVENEKHTLRTWNMAKNTEKHEK
jgi:hypothetical protein